MKLGELVLRSISRNPCEKDYYIGRGDYWNTENALDLLKRVYPDFPHLIRGKSVVDFGCGDGYQSVAMVLNGAARVLAIDTSSTALHKARQLAKKHGVHDQIEFRENAGEDRETYDLALSQNSMEHFDDPLRILQVMRELVKPDGKLFITFGPPWYAPYGSHTGYFTVVPWINVLFDEKTVMGVRSRYRTDGATKYEEIEGGLNKMTIRKFESLTKDIALHMAYFHYDCVKKMNFLKNIPVVRELCINHVSCILEKR